jgi:iron complex transport system substrate-binding protein
MGAGGVTADPRSREEDMSRPAAGRAVTGLGLSLSCALLCGAAHAQQATAYPVEVENCGRPLSFAAAPERAVIIGQGTTEILLSLGRGDSIAGTAVWLAPLPAALEAEGSALPRIADNSPSFEAVLAESPDFVAAQWINDISPEESRVGTFAQFADFGVPAYVSPAECVKSDFTAGSGDGARSEAWTMDLLEQEVAELGLIFDVQGPAADLIAQNRARVEQAAADVAATGAEDVTVLYWFSSPELEGEAYVAGNLGAPGWISDAVGVTNAVDSAEEWPLVGWETLASLDPDVIVLGTMDRRNLPADDVAEKRRFLETDPVASQMTAVREGRLIEMDAQSMNPTLRAVDGVETLAEGLRDLGLAP